MILQVYMIYLEKSCKSCLTLFLAIKFLKYLREPFDIRSSLFQCAPAVEISGPCRRLREGLGRIFVEHLGHHRDQITDDAVVLDQSFNDRISQPRLLIIEILSH